MVSRVCVYLVKILVIWLDSLAEVTHQHRKKSVSDYYTLKHGLKTCILQSLFISFPCCSPNTTSASDWVVISGIACLKCVWYSV